MTILNSHNNKRTVEKNSPFGKPEDFLEMTAVSTFFENKMPPNTAMILLSK